MGAKSSTLAFGVAERSSGGGRAGGGVAAASGAAPHNNPSTRPAVAHPHWR